MPNDGGWAQVLMKDADPTCDESVTNDKRRVCGCKGLHFLQFSPYSASDCVFCCVNENEKKIYARLGDWVPPLREPLSLPIDG